VSRRRVSSVRASEFATREYEHVANAVVAILAGVADDEDLAKTPPEEVPKHLDFTPAGELLAIVGHPVQLY